MPKAYLIDPATRTIEPFDYVAGEGFPGVFRVGLCTGFIYPNGDVLYVDDGNAAAPRASLRRR